jgi:hypothetical protein
MRPEKYYVVYNCTGIIAYGDDKQIVKQWVKVHGGKKELGIGTIKVNDKVQRDFETRCDYIGEEYLSGIPMTNSEEEVVYIMLGDYMSYLTRISISFVEHILSLKNLDGKEKESIMELTLFLLEFASRDMDDCESDAEYIDMGKLVTNLYNGYMCIDKR